MTGYRLRCFPKIGFASIRLVCSVCHILNQLPHGVRSYELRTVNSASLFNYVRQCECMLRGCTVVASPDAVRYHEGPSGAYRFRRHARGLCRRRNSEGISFSSPRIVHGRHWSMWWRIWLFRWWECRRVSGLLPNNGNRLDATWIENHEGCTDENATCDLARGHRLYANF